MIIGIGTDIVDVERFKNLPKSQALMWFSDEENQYCKSKYYPQRHYAPRWAAKKAFIKAAGHRLQQVLSKSDKMKNIVIMKEGDLPTIELREEMAELNASEYNIQVSLSHCNKYATAVVIIQYDSSAVLYRI